MRRKDHQVRVSDAQIDRAIVRAREFEAVDRRVVDALYEPGEDLINLYFDDGMRVSIPRKQLQGLEYADPSKLSRIEIVGKGTGLHWPLLDVDHYVLGLLNHRFGTKRWMNDLGRRGGSVRNLAKAKAARRNGLKGGRPKGTKRESIRQ